jgi:2-oxoglutarate ferredoxin oxidoreductase subunit delta
MARNMLTFDEAYCKGCQLCVVTCPKSILQLDKSRVNSNGYNPIMCREPEECIGCAMCARVCPDSVIKVEREE